jgi:hypothetical protein
VSEAVRKNISRELADTELPDLLSAQRQRSQGPLQALADKPMLLQACRVHTFAVIEDADRGALLVEVSRRENRYPLRAGVE